MSGHHPTYELKKTKGADDKCVPNVLPCRVHHDGPVNASDRYWKPASEEDGSLTSYFRGRKLRGTSAKVPQGYKGAVLEKTQRAVSKPVEVLGRSSHIEEDDFDAEEPEPENCTAMDQLASFDEIVVWGHDVPPNDTEDPYFKGMTEWVQFAEAEWQMHAYPHGADDEKQSLTTNSRPETTTSLPRS